MEGRGGEWRGVERKRVREGERRMGEEVSRGAEVMERRAMEERAR